MVSVTRDVGAPRDPRGCRRLHHGVGEIFARRGKTHAQRSHLTDVRVQGLWRDRHAVRRGGVTARVRDTRGTHGENLAQTLGLTNLARETVQFRRELVVNVQRRCAAQALGGEVYNRLWCVCVSFFFFFFFFFFFIFFFF
jgi:hypothetical protein